MLEKSFKQGLPEIVKEYYDELRKVKAWREYETVPEVGRQ